MNCRKVRSYLSTYSEGSLPSEVLKELEVHIRDCQSCEREKHFLEEIKVTARSLSGKTTPNDFNLKLMNRLYADQSHPTESFLPTPAPSWYTRPVSWVSGLATVAVVVLFAFIFLRTPADSPDLQNGGASYSQTGNGAVIPAAAVRHARPRVPANVYENIIGVSGAASNYRSSNLAQARVMRLADAKVESLYVGMMRRLGVDFIPASAWMRADNHYNDPYSPYVRTRIDAPLIRNAAVTTTY